MQRAARIRADRSERRPRGGHPRSRRQARAAGTRYRILSVPKSRAKRPTASQSKRSRTDGRGAEVTSSALPPNLHSQNRGGGLLIYPPFDVIAERLPHLPRQQARFAETLLAQPELVAFGSVRAVAS